MTVPATTRRAGPFAGNGSTTAFPFTFKVFTTADIEVVLADVDGLETVLVLDSDYSVTLNPDQDATPGGSVTYPISGTPLAVGETLAVVGALDNSQTLDLPGGGAFSPTSVENAFDRTAIQIQQLAETIGRSLTLPATAASANTSLPAPTAGNVIGWNETADALVNYDANDLATVVVAGTSYCDVFDGTGAQTQFVLTSDPGSVNALDVAISGVSQVNGVDFSVSGTTLTFVSPPPSGAGNIAVRYVAALPVGSADARDINYLPSGTGAVARTQAARNMDLISIADFGAVSGNIVTTQVNLAISAAVALGKKGVLFPAGNWYLDAGVTWAPGVNWYGEGVESTRVGAASFPSASGLPMVTITSSPGWKISGIRFEGADKASGIKATDSYWGRMEMCHVNGIKGKGVELIESAGTVLDQVSMYYFSAATDYGVFLAGGSAVDLRSCYLNTEAIALAADTGTVSGAICRGVMFEGNAVAVRWPLNQNPLVLDGCFFEGIGSAQEVLEIGEHGSGTKPDVIARGNIIASTLNNVVTISNATRVVWEGNTTGKNVIFTSGIDRLWHGRGNNYAGGAAPTLSAQLFIDDNASGSVKYSSTGNDVLINQYTDPTTGSVRVITNAAAGAYKPETVSCSHFALDQAGSGHRVKEGANCKQGTATLVGGTATVANTAVTANSRIFLTSQADGGTPGFLRVSARVAGTSFTITSSSGTDTSTVAYEIFEPA